MVTARNYAAQAEYALRRKEMWGGPVKIDKTRNDAIAIIEASVHFAIPDGGKILDSGYKGLFDKPLNLPYDYMTLEYFTPINEINTVEKIKAKQPLSIDKHLIVAYQTEVEIVIFMFKHLPGINQWLFSDSAIEIERGFIFTNPNDLQFKILHINGLTEQDQETSARNIVHSLPPLFELLEALSCKNVSTEPIEKIDQKKNAKRIKAGKVPIYETKVLVVNTTQYNSKGERTGTHASPRQHLRRGHIRRYKSGINIWVNSTVVGDPSKGVINKTYVVK